MFDPNRCPRAPAGAIFLLLAGLGMLLGGCMATDSVVTRSSPTQTARTAQASAPSPMLGTGYWAKKSMGPGPRPRPYACPPAAAALARR